jgi:uncharacterized protein (TIGR02246 family)
MTRLVGFALVAAAMACSACSRESGPVFDRADVDSINKVIQELATAFNAEDPAKTAALYSLNGVVMPPNRSLMRGRSFVEQYYLDRFAEGASDLQVQSTDVSGQGTLAYASGDYRLNLVPKDGGQSRRDRGKFLWLFREQDGRWMIEYVVFSSDFVTPPNI